MFMKSKKWFTLIELMIVITIIAIVSMVSYAPYNYYKNKAKLKNTASKITQLLYDSRNMAVNGMVGSMWNVSVWVYFDSNNNNEINVYSYPHNINQADIDYVEWWDIKKIKSIYLDKWIQIDWIEGMDNLLFYFDSISWDVKYYNWNWWVRTLIPDDEVVIDFSYNWSTSPNLKKTISYFTSTNIIDY